MNLFLIGYRCTGKTTIGKSIAMTIDWSFVDSDILVIKKCGKSIKDIVDTEGWESFSPPGAFNTEADLHKGSAGRGHRRREWCSMQIMSRQCKPAVWVIWLGATAETIQKRMLQDKNTGNFRPALTDKGTDGRNRRHAVEEKSLL